MTTASKLAGENGKASTSPTSKRISLCSREAARIARTLPSTAVSDRSGLAWWMARAMFPPPQPASRQAPRIEARSSRQ